MKTLKWSVLGVLIVEVLLALYKVPIASTNIILLCAGGTICLFLVVQVLSLFMKYANAQSARMERMFYAAQFDRAEERKELTSVAHHALETAQVNAQAAALIAERVAQGVRIYKDGARYVLAVPGYDRLIDARNEAGMDTAMIDLMAEEQRPYLLESGE